MEEERNGRLCYMSTGHCILLCWINTHALCTKGASPVSKWHIKQLNHPHIQLCLLNHLSDTKTSP